MLSIHTAKYVEMFKEVKDTDTNMTYYQDQKQTDLKQNGILKK